MSLLLIVLAVFFGTVVWCAGAQLWRMLRTAAEGRQAVVPRPPLAVIVRATGD